MDPHIFADLDPGSQYVADPTDPDPKYRLNSQKLIMIKGGGGIKRITLQKI